MYTLVNLLPTVITFIILLVNSIMNVINSVDISFFEDLCIYWLLDLIIKKKTASTLLNFPLDLIWFCIFISELEAMMITANFFFNFVTVINAVKPN
jgi:hypothetical protein